MLGHTDEDVPGTPDTEYDPYLYSGQQVRHNEDDFAGLFPDNNLARQAFSDVVEKVRSDRSSYEHVEQFLVVNDFKEPLKSWSGTDTEASPTEESDSIWTGYFRFSFLCLPRDPRRGWILGGGDHEFGAVDHLLTLKKQQHQVHSRHARLLHNENGVWMLHNDKRKVIVDGKEKVSGMRQMGEQITSLTFGDLTYHLKWFTSSESWYRDQLQNFRTRFGMGHVAHPRSLSLTPSDAFVEHKDYYFHRPFAAGGFGTIISATEKSTGKIVGVKRFKKTRQNKHSIDLEIQLYNRIGLSHVSVLLS